MHKRSKWLTSDGEFLTGHMRGRPAGDVARTHPAYIKWILDELPCCDEDRETLTKLLDGRGQHER